MEKNKKHGKLCERARCVTIIDLVRSTSQSTY